MVILTARDTEIDTVVGLDAGATEYVTKPFSTHVLLARLRAHLRSSGPGPARELVFGDLRLDVEGFRAFRGSSEVLLRPKEMALLLRLATSAGRVLTRDQLLDDVWDMSWETGTKPSVIEGAVGSVGDVVGDEACELVLVPDDGSVEEFAALGSDPAFGEGVRDGCSDRGFEDVEAFGSEDLVESVDELAASVTHERSGICEALRVAQEQVAGCLGGPWTGRVGGDAGEEHLAVGDVYEETDSNGAAERCRQWRSRRRRLLGIVGTGSRSRWCGGVRDRCRCV